ncbi:hypothetical protein PAXINDRAFT_117466 [Paxillus involutus ATCC 200175]|uniref:Nitrogen regulatory protein areA GATA-like domain-containing protein n=1 Tax=Paxillus involutus ATCC 200175 TaxID=664439 RepID=A0A0C9U083_PAXIN|nr:hypothetical protein PAXINDRAFT_117466 [Paxillus involutus ATCC 200175]
MLATFPAPVLSVTADAVRDLQGHEALSSLWMIFTKCKESLQDGRRLENISWRLWYRELVLAQTTYQPMTPDSEIHCSRPKCSRTLSSFFPSDDDAKKAVVPQVALALGLPSPTPTDQPSPPSRSSIPTLGLPPTPERPRIYPSRSAAPPSTSFSRRRPSSSVGRIIVDMLPNNTLLPEKRSLPSTTAMTTTSSTHSAVVPPISCDHRIPSVPLLATPTLTEASFPRVVVVNPTPRPTPPSTPMLDEDSPGAPQPPSTFLLPPLPPPALRLRQPQPPPQLLPKEPSPPALVRGADAGSMLRQADRRFFLQQSPEAASPEGGDGSTASGKSPSELFEASSAASSQMKSVLTDVDVDGDDKEEEDDDGRSEVVAGAGHPANAHGHGRHSLGHKKKGKETGRGRPGMKRSHSTRHAAPSMGRKPSGQAPQQPQPQQERSDKRGAMFNIGSGSSNGSRSANGSTADGDARLPPTVGGSTVMQPLLKDVPLQARPPVLPNVPANGHVTNATAANGIAKANAVPNGNGNCNGNGNAQSRRTIVVASISSEEYETTDGEDSEEWASEEMDADDKAKEAEETRLREAAVEAQRQRDLFAKVPKRSYSNLNRTQSGLLSQLMNPSPSIFPPNHPYRTSRSSHDLAHQYQRNQQQQLPQAQVPQRSSSAFAPARLSTSKSAVALPLAAQITAISRSRPSPPTGMKRQDSEKNGYRPKGPPKEQEMEDDSGEEHDVEDRIQVSQSIAQQRLQALMSRRSSGTSSFHVQPPPVGGPGLLASTATAPIPVGHPYNLPAPTAPMTPRTTRRRMLKTELSESMRRQLLWERQVSSNANPALTARRAASQAPMGGLRPLTSVASTSKVEGNTSTTKNAEAEDKDERRRRAMARNRSWADDYHYSGW